MKYHISNDGISRKCTAKTPGNCAASFIDKHFNTIEDAQ